MGLITKVALSKYGQKFYRYAADPKNQRFFSVTLPGLETLAATACYCWATARQKNIDEDRRSLLQIQNIGSGIVGFAVGSWLNRKVYDYSEKIIPHIDPKLVPDVHKVVNGVRVGLPILVTGLLMRMAIPSVIAWASGKIEEVRRSKRDKKLNVVA